MFIGQHEIINNKNFTRKTTAFNVSQILKLVSDKLLTLK